MENPTATAVAALDTEAVILLEQEYLTVEDRNRAQVTLEQLINKYCPLEDVPNMELEWL